MLFPALSPSVQRSIATRLCEQTQKTMVHTMLEAAVDFDDVLELDIMEYAGLTEIEVPTQRAKALRQVAHYNQSYILCKPISEKG